MYRHMRNCAPKIVTAKPNKSAVQSSNDIADEKNYASPISSVATLLGDKAEVIEESEPLFEQSTLENSFIKMELKVLPVEPIVNVPEKSKEHISLDNHFKCCIDKIAPKTDRLELVSPDSTDVRRNLQDLKKLYEDIKRHSSNGAMQVTSKSVNISSPTTTSACTNTDTAVQNFPVNRCFTRNIIM